MPITHMFLDVGGVLLTNGWGGDARKRAAEQFHLDIGEMNERHHLTFDTYEVGKITLDQYLDRIVFYRPRPFTRSEFLKFLYDQSQALPEMIDTMKAIKAKYCLKVATISNEGAEITRHRVEYFNLRSLCDFFVFSAFVHLRKPDAEIFRLALDIAQIQPDQSVYIDDRQLFAEVAAGVGIHAIHHTSVESTKAALAELGLGL